MISLDNKVNNILPEFQINESVTFRHLLQHTSGIKNIFEFENIWKIMQTEEYSQKELLKLALAEPYDFIPGNGFKYIGTDYIILKQLIERISGRSFYSFLQEEIFTKLEMFDSVLLNSYVNYINIAKCYEISSGKLISGIEYNQELLHGPGGIYCSAEDLDKWFKQIINPSLISEHLLNQMIEPNIYNYGFGWGIEKNDNKQLLQHLGAMPSTGSYSCIQIYREEKHFAAILSNYGLPDVLKICSAINDIINNKPVSAPESPLENKIHHNDLLKYEGVYKGFLSFRISAESDKLCMEFDFGNNKDKKIDTYYSIGKNCFFNLYRDQQISFDIDENGNVSLWGISKITE